MDKQPIPEQVIADLQAERLYQLSKGAKGKLPGMEGWSYEFDNKNTPNDWAAFITTYCGRAAAIGADAGSFRAEMVKVAALAVAAIEAYDRQLGAMPKRHYDK